MDSGGVFQCEEREESPAMWSRSPGKEGNVGNQIAPSGERIDTIGGMQANREEGQTSHGCDGSPDRGNRPVEGEEDSPSGSSPGHASKRLALTVLPNRRGCHAITCEAPPSHGCYTSPVGEGNGRAHIGARSVYICGNNSYLWRGKGPGGSRGKGRGGPGVAGNPGPVWKVGFQPGYQ